MGKAIAYLICLANASLLLITLYISNNFVIVHYSFVIPILITISILGIFFSLKAAKALDGEEGS